MLQYELRGDGGQLLAPDYDGFEEMYRSYRRRVRGLCRSLLRGSADADDACQDVMVRAYQAWPRFREGAAVWPWLATITTNVCRDSTRRQQMSRRKLGTPVDDGSVEEFAAAGVVPDAYDSVVAKARTELVADALEAVPPAYRSALYLREIEGWGLPEIAKASGRSVASVRSTLTRGRRVLAERVEALARSRNQWPLPAVVVSGTDWLRVRAAKVRAALNDVAIGGVARMDAVLSALTAVRAEAAAPAIAAIAAFAVFVGSGSAEHQAATPVAPAAVATAVTPAPPADQPAGSADTGASAIHPGPALAVTPARLPASSDGTTATPAVEASPGPAPVDDGGQADKVYLGPTSVNCPNPDNRTEAMGVLCSALESLAATG